jgi:hypothetical protein
LLCIYGLIEKKNRFSKSLEFTDIDAYRYFSRYLFLIGGDIHIYLYIYIGKDENSPHVDILPYDSAECSAECSPGTATALSCFNSYGNQKYVYVQMYIHKYVCIYVYVCM